MENRTGKYFKYAIGEIVLVVIGILIALQLNNWNDTVKERSVEIKILQEILSNLEHDLVEIRSDIESMDSINKATKDINRFMKTDSIPSETFFYDVAKIRVNPHFDPNKSGYNLLVSKGVEIILNDSLRGSLSLLYESLYPYYYRYEEERTQFKLQEINPSLLQYFEWHARPELQFFGHYQISSMDYLMIKKDADFSKLLYAIAFDNTLVQNRAHRVERGIESLIFEIENELKTKVE
ncbi:DUF6090 family protein [uncultured Maribacter sp.]|uniref:DUF6090 family protein n=1 Tax=uncultured Maribacter sp. TaxID=431308 RepID=UPI0030D88E25|tara:strand:- start:124 stop:834 length:711 start_codon:yes stop_codon:yes gene_type:complete